MQCFYQLFGLSFWRHPLTAEDPLVSKWCNAKFLQICFNEKINASTSWIAWGWVNCKHILIFGRTIPLRTFFASFQIGDRVMAFVNYSAWAEVVCTPLDFVHKIPDDMTFPEAAAFSMNFVAAYMMLFEVANLREGMSVLVHSAGGAVVSLLLWGKGLVKKLWSRRY